MFESFFVIMALIALIAFIAGSQNGYEKGYERGRKLCNESWENDIIGRGLAEWESYPCRDGVRTRLKWKR